ncbi:Oidioi.mRNA.OKI2018_I69.chr1.g472.t1.cds [Oikopleura dioica]|uniref:Oidioi.mRNA.OKI2018_I69.chr1.g472.t1.cds n=1 Tax=Oikopleura dioica TaxID=34765 RepID=A0ABN7SJZ5_OIKDI|nr:Oidioi.mRNA.OKI2018_I69.chr1.g472.t1.cds [Oikopleura dioica]
MEYEKVYRNPPNPYQPIILLLEMGLLVNSVYIIITPRFADFNAELRIGFRSVSLFLCFYNLLIRKSASLVGDSDKQRGLFWECIVGSPVSYSCFYLEDSILDMEMTYLVMRGLAVLSSIFIFLGMCFGFMGMSTTRIYEDNNCKKLVWKSTSAIFIFMSGVMICVVCSWYALFVLKEHGHGDMEFDFGLCLYLGWGQSIASLFIVYLILLQDDREEDSPLETKGPLPTYCDYPTTPYQLTNQCYL